MFFVVALTLSLLQAPPADRLAGAWEVKTLALDPAHRHVNGHYTLTLTPAGQDYRVHLIRHGEGDATGDATLHLAQLPEEGTPRALQGAFDIVLSAGATTTPMHLELTFTRRLGSRVATFASPDAKAAWTCDGYFEHRGASFAVPEGDPDDKGAGHGSTFWGVLAAARTKAPALTHTSHLSCLSCCDAFLRCGGMGPGSCNGSNMCRDACFDPEGPTEGHPAACIDANLR